MAATSAADMGAEAAPAAEANSNRFKNFDQSGWFSRLTFGYVTPLISHGFRRKIDPEVRNAVSKRTSPIDVANSWL